MTNSDKYSLHWINGKAFFSEIKPIIIEPQPILCISEESYADILEESKSMMQMEMSLYLQVGKYFFEKYKEE